MTLRQRGDDCSVCYEISQWAPTRSRPQSGRSDQPGSRYSPPSSQGLNFSYDANLNLFLDSQQFAL